MSQDWTRTYNKINWQNYPSTATPLNETNLLKIDNSLYEVDGRVITLDGTKFDTTSANELFKSVSYTASTGTFVFTKWDNSTVTINTDIEKIAVNFDYDDDPTSPHYQNLVITLEDGTVKYVDMSALITEYEFTTSTTITFTVAADGTVSASVRDGSIGFTQLDAAVTTYIDGKEAEAEADALVSEGWAKGTQNGTPVASGTYFEDNSKYYSEQSEQSKLFAEGISVGQQNGVDVDSSSPYWHNNAKYYSDNAQAIAAQNFGGLNDVQFEDLQDGQVPIYDAADQIWYNGTIETATSFEDLTDTSIIDAQPLDKPIYDGTNWVNVPSGDIGVMTNPLQAESGEFITDSDNHPIMLMYDAMAQTQLLALNMELLHDDKCLLDLGENYYLTDENGVFIEF